MQIVTNFHRKSIFQEFSTPFRIQSKFKNWIKIAMLRRSLYFCKLEMLTLYATDTSSQLDFVAMQSDRIAQID